MYWFPVGKSIAARLNLGIDLLIVHVMTFPA